MRYAIIVALIPSMVFAHGGGLDSKGGHFNRKTGEYHYHRGGPTESNPPPARTTPRTSVRVTPRTTARRSSPSVTRKEPQTLFQTPAKSRDDIAEEKYNEAIAAIESATTTLRSLAEDYADTRAGKDALAVLAKRAPCDGAISEVDQASVDEQREKAAQAKLKLAKNLIERGVGGKQWLQDIVDEYPETDAAREAQSLLDKL